MAPHAGKLEYHTVQWLFPLNWRRIHYHPSIPSLLQWVTLVLNELGVKSSIWRQLWSSASREYQKYRISRIFASIYSRITNTHIREWLWLCYLRECKYQFSGKLIFANISSCNTQPKFQSSMVNLSLFNTSPLWNQNILHLHQLDLYFRCKTTTLETSLLWQLLDRLNTASVMANQMVEHARQGLVWVFDNV
jgi:hypothetical protein